MESPPFEVLAAYDQFAHVRVCPTSPLNAL